MLKVTLLGQFSVNHDGTPVEINSRPAQILLAYLTIHKGKLHPRQQLAGYLWPESYESSARKNLRNAIWQLRKAIGSNFLLIDNGSIGFNTDTPHEIDTALLADERIESDTGALIRALSMYKGELLPGFYEDWIQSEREWLWSLFERRMQVLLERLIKAARWSEVESWAEYWIVRGHTPEPAYRALMLAHAASSNLAGMAIAYQRCVQALKVDLDVSPSTETQQLYQRLRLGDVPSNPMENSRYELARLPAYSELGQSFSVPAVPIHNLPPQLTPFVNRDKELTEIRQLLIGKSDIRLVTILGPGGIGKTRLALQVASSLKENFDHGVYFVPLAGIESPAHIIPTLIEHLSFHVHPGSEPKQQLLDYLREKQALLVVDNFEHLLAGAWQLAEILLAAPGVKIITTSHERLNLGGEAVYTLGSMQFPEMDDLHNALDYSAVQLLMHSAHMVRPDLEWASFELEEIVRICHLVQGMPLALVLAAGWLEALSFKEIADEIAKNLDFLESQAQDTPDRQRNMRAAFEYSWKRLPDEEQLAFMYLSVFRGGFTLQAAQAVAGVQVRTLRTLVNKSFLSRSPDGRYQVHELLRQYAQEYLEASTQFRNINRKHCNYFLETLQDLETNLRGADQLDAVEKIEADMENVRAAWNWAVQCKIAPEIGRAAESLYLYFVCRNRYQEGAEIFYSAREQLAPSPDHEASLALARVLSRYSFLLSFSSLDKESIPGDLEQGLVIAYQKQDLEEIAFNLLIQGCYHTHVTRDYAVAITRFEESLARFKIIEDRFYTAVVLLWLGEAYDCSNDLNAFTQATRECLDIALELGDSFISSYALNNLVNVSFCTGDYRSVEHYCHASLTNENKINLLLGLSETNTQLGVLRLLQGDLQAARDLVEQSLEMAKDIYYPRLKALALAGLGLEAGISGDYLLGRQLSQESLETPPADVLGFVLSSWGVALASCGMHDWEAGWRAVRECLSHANSLSSLAMLTWPLPVAAVLLAEEGQLEQAVEVLALASTHPLSPAKWMEQWAMLTRLRADLQAEIGPGNYMAAWERGKELDVTKVAAKLMEVASKPRQASRLQLQSEPLPT
jgi:predicted ATPase/DNA-binding SARP family transcriptional activator